MLEISAAGAAAAAACAAANMAAINAMNHATDGGVPAVALICAVIFTIGLSIILWRKC